MLKLLFIFFCLFGCETSKPKPIVLVNISPYAYFVQKIAGSTVDIKIIVEANRDPHNFEPSPKQVDLIRSADIWFCLGEGFEDKIIAVLKELKPGVEILNLNATSTEDKHVWLSPILAKSQAKVIADFLIKKYPQNSSFYAKNLKTFLSELSMVDSDLKRLLKPIKKGLIVVSHPAFFYFCRDYNLVQVSIEQNGKEPTAKELLKVMNIVKEKGVKMLFLEPQHSSKEALLIAKELHLDTKVIDPYAFDYLENLKAIGKAFADSNTY